MICRIITVADCISHQVAGNTLPVDLSGLLDRFKVKLIESELDNCEGMLAQGNESLGESIYDPQIGKVLSLLMVP